MTFKSSGILFLLGFILMSFEVIAQNKPIKITGVVFEEASKNPIPFANVMYVVKQI